MMGLCSKFARWSSALLALFATSAASSATPTRGIDSAGIAAATPSCGAAAGTFVCGLSNAEDLVRLPGTPWVVVTSLNFEFKPGLPGKYGPLSAVRIDTRAVQPLYPVAESIVDWDRNIYPDCSKPPEPFSSHGINVTALGGNSFRLYVVNHGERQSVEIIDVAVRGGRLSTKWRGCLLAPTGMFPNSVAPLPDGGIALSGNGVAIWRPREGWRKLDGLTGSNGIELSRDGRWLFVALHDADSVVRVPVEGGAPQPVATLRFHADNLRWGDDGYLYVAGAKWPQDFAVAKCLSDPVCEIGFGAASIDPETLETREIINSEAIKGRFGMATAALRVGDELWIGTARGDRALVVPGR